MFRVDKGEGYSTRIKGKASIAWVKTWGLAGYDLVRLQGNQHNGHYGGEKNRVAQRV